VFGGRVKIIILPLAMVNFPISKGSLPYPLILFRIQSVVDGLQPEKSMPKINNRDINNWYCDSVETFDLEIPTQEIGNLSPKLVYCVTAE
jgi:hypothetical protein